MISSGGSLTFHDFVYNSVPSDVVKLPSVVSVMLLETVRQGATCVLGCVVWLQSMQRSFCLEWNWFVV